ncbi:DinB family protein [bacterium]|nr:DinB family protein [bacterium]
MNLAKTIESMFERDLTKLKFEIESYKNEANLWITDKEVTNSAGNLCLHLIGNLNWFIGAQLGQTGYVRQRELEFSAKDIPASDLIREIEQTQLIISETLNKLNEDQLNQDFPINVFNKSMSTQHFLVHLTTHLAYHLGQINYHRRLME